MTMMMIMHDDDKDKITCMTGWFLVVIAMSWWL